MKIDLPSIADQQLFVFQQSTRAAIEQLTANLEAPRFPPQTAVDEAQYSRAHLLREREGWQAPAPEIVRAYFEHFQAHFPQYDTDQALAALLGLSDKRRIRAYKKGSETVPYGVWRHFLISTGRAAQEITPVIAFMG